MADSELNIILKLSDEATKKLESFREGVKSVGEDIKHTGQQLSRFGMNVTFLGATITGPLALAFKTASEYSTEANKAMNNLTNATINLQTAVGTALAPVVNSLAGDIQKLTNWFNSLDESMRNNIVQLTLIGGIILTVGGAVTSLIGKVIQLAGAFLSFASVYWPLLAIAGAVILLIRYWEQARNVVIPILNFIEIGLKTLDIGILKLVDGVMFLVQAFVNILQPVVAPIIKGVLIAFKTLDIGILKVVDGVMMMANALINTLKPAIFSVADSMYQMYLISDAQIKKVHETFAGIGPSIQSQREVIKYAVQSIQDDISNIMNSNPGQGIGAGIGQQRIIIESAVQQLQNDIQAIMEKGKGNFASWADTGIRDINALIKKFQDFVKEIQSGTNVKIPTAIKVMDNSLKGISLTFSAIGSAASQALESVAMYFQQAQGETHKYGGIIKAIRIGETIINTATAIMRAYVEWPWPMSSAIAGLMAATGAMQIATISAQKMATGGEGIVTKPTLFLAGEAGPERYSFTPMSKDRGSSGPTTISVHMENVSFRNEDDIEDVMTRLSDLIAIRSRSKI